MFTGKGELVLRSGLRLPLRYEYIVSLPQRPPLPFSDLQLINLAHLGFLAHALDRCMAQSSPVQARNSISTCKIGETQRVLGRLSRSGGLGTIRVSSSRRSAVALVVC